MGLFSYFSKPKSILTPEAKKRGASLPVSRGGAGNPFDKLTKATTSRGPKVQPNIINNTKDYGISFSSDIANATLPKGKLTFQNGMFGTTAAPVIQGQPGAFTPLMAGTKQDRPALPTMGRTSSPSSEGSGGSGGPATLAADLSAENMTTVADNNQAMSSDTGASAGNIEGGAGGYSPPGLSYLEEEQIDTSTPDPKNTVAQPFTNPKGAGALSSGSGSLAGGTPPSKYQQGFNQAGQALASMGIDGMNIPGGQGASLVNQYSPTKRNDTSSMFVQSDPFINGLVTAWQDFINPQNQRKSLTDTYNQMIKDSGIQAIDMELVDMKKVIEGTEDDIRTEITKAGGFATESQVLAMTNARNKQLIKNYNTLLDTRNAKEKYLNTAIQLEEADRQSADQRFESMFSMGTQLATMQQQIQNNARSQMQWLATNVGFDGLLESTGGDPFAMELIESSLGLPRGGLITSANKARQAKIQAEQERALDLDLKRSQLQTESLRRDDIRSQIKSRSIQDMIDMQKLGGGVSEEQRQLSSLDLINTLDGVQQHSGLNNAVGPSFMKWFTRAATPGGAKQSFIGDVQNIVDNMSLDKLIKAKAEGATFGALSDNELRMLGSSATKIGTWAKKNKNGEVVGYNVSEKAFRNELDRISALTKRAYVLSGYDAADVGAIQTKDGKVWVQNSDGSMSQIR